MRVILFAVGIIVVVVGAVQAELKEGPWPTDPELAKVEQEVKEKKKSCKEIKNIHKKIECSSKVRAEFGSKGLLRGTQQYVDLHYVDLSTPELRTKLKELEALRDQARTTSEAKHDREPGELSQDALIAEIEAILMEMDKRDVLKHKDNLKFYKGLQNKK